MSNHTYGFHIVTLRTAIEINGRKVMAQAAANVEAWQQDDRYREAMKAQLRHALGEAIVAELNPEITAEAPTPTLHEQLTDALHPFDYPHGERGL
jgi:hypothetical protein